MSVCNAYGCDFSVEAILVQIDNGKKKVTLCPNHVLIFAKELFQHEEIYVEPSEKKHLPVCECCGRKESIEYKDHDATLYLCSHHLTDLIDRNLSPRDFKILRHKHGDIYILHDDFYEPISGEALQPVER